MWPTCELQTSTALQIPMYENVCHNFCMLYIVMAVVEANNLECGQDPGSTDWDTAQRMYLLMKRVYHVSSFFSGTLGEETYTPPISGITLEHMTKWHCVVCKHKVVLIADMYIHIM